METINKGFKDAAVTTHLCEIVTEANDITVEDFEITQYTDPQLSKYFRVLRTREHYAIDSATQALIFDSGLNNNTTIIIDHRFIPHKHLAYSKTTDEYKWNVLETLTLKELADKHAGKVSFRKGTALNKYVITFKSSIEKTNVVNFMYSSSGFRFMSKLATAVNADSSVDINKLFPKVDWTRAWTVEEILADYGYTETEIAEVMSDLENFKDRDRD
jgi:hypothetical protein